ncbi:MAG: S1C family serine protease [Fidelibacterota bacterium]
MKRILLLLGLLAGLAFPQNKQVIVTKIQDSESVKDVNVSIQNDMVTVTVNVDGEEKTFAANLNDEEAMSALENMLAEMDVDIDVFSDDGQDPFQWRTESQGFLGVQLSDLTPQLRKYFNVKDDRGVLVAEVLEDSPAEASGIKAGDVIVAVNDKDIATARDLSRTIRQYEPEEKITLTIIRKGKEKSRQVTLGEMERPALAFMSRKHMIPMMDDFPFTWKMDDDKDWLYFQGDDDLREDLEQLRQEIRALREEMDQLKN